MTLFTNSYCLWILTVVKASLIPLACHMCEKAAHVNSPPILFIQSDGQGYCTRQVFPNNMLMCLDALLLIHMILAQ